MSDAEQSGEAMALNEPPFRVLLFDDNDVDRVTVSRALHECGVRVMVIEPSSKSEAIEHIRRAGFDCIFIGDSVARTQLFSLLLRIHEAGVNVPIVIVTYDVTSTSPATRGAIQFLSTSAVTSERLASICRESATT